MGTKMTDRVWSPEEQKEHRKLWVEALRSGKYQQTDSFLFAGRGFCCLGVACDVSGLGTWEKIHGFDYHAYVVGSDRSDNDLPNAVRRWLGLTSPEGLYHEGGERGRGSCLSAQNDNYGATFSEIADIIEREPEGLIETASS